MSWYNWSNRSDDDFSSEDGNQGAQVVTTSFKEDPVQDSGADSGSAVSFQNYPPMEANPESSGSSSPKNSEDITLDMGAEHTNEKHAKVNGKRRKAPKTPKEDLEKVNLGKEDGSTSPKIVVEMEPQDYTRQQDKPPSYGEPEDKNCKINGNKSRDRKPNNPLPMQVFDNTGYLSNEDTVNSRSDQRVVGRFTASKVKPKSATDTYTGSMGYSAPTTDNESEYVSEADDGTVNDGGPYRITRSPSCINIQETMLLHSELKKINVKDFHKEVRASMDVEDFIKDGDIFLDVHANSLEDVINHILDRVRHKEKDINLRDAMKNILTTPLDAFTNSLQGTCIYDGWVDLDQSWVCGLCSLAALSTRRICIAKLKHAMNMGPTTQEVRFVILILTPANTKRTKNDLEVGRTISTLFCDVNFRSEMMHAHHDSDVMRAIEKRVAILKETRVRKTPDLRKVSSGAEITFFDSVAGDGNYPHDEKETKFSDYLNYKWLFRGIRQDLARRLPHYVRDFTDGIAGFRAISKLLSTTLFLYFAILLPLLALGVTNSKNTDEKMTIKKMIIAQAFGGAIYSFLGGQHLVILVTTAPVVIFTYIIKSISKDLDQDFYAMYCVSGMFNSFFLLIYSCTNCCYLMKFCYRSVDEIFGVFISIAFVTDAIKSVVHIFDDHYCTRLASDIPQNLSFTKETFEEEFIREDCGKEIALLALLLMLGTLWLGVTLFNFTKSPYLDSTKRVLLADYALPCAVITFSFVASYLAKDIDSPKIESGGDENYFKFPEISKLDAKGWLISAVMGFCLSILFFIDQNISASFVNTPKNNLKKGAAYHLDLLVLSVINAVLSLFALPWIHGALPHSPLHVRALAEFEERMQQGVMTDVVVKVHETRLTSIFANGLIGLSILFFPEPIEWIRVPVLNGVLLYVAAVSLVGNEFFERLLLWVTEQSAYPPNHYVRHVTQKKIHLFTFCQVLQLVVLCALGFAPFSYLKMVFPVALGCFMPIRHLLFPKIFEQHYLDALDGH